MGAINLTIKKENWTTWQYRSSAALISKQQRAAGGIPSSVLQEKPNSLPALKGSRVDSSANTYKQSNLSDALVRYP
jgi:hypothetical protein